MLVPDNSNKCVSRHSDTQQERNVWDCHYHQSGLRHLCDSSTRLPPIPLHYVLDTRFRSLNRKLSHLQALADCQ